MTVSAMAAMEKGSKLQSFEYSLEELKPHECIIEIENCGVCHSDINLINDDWKVSEFPLVPGHEIIGKVAQVGSDISHINKGDRVGVGWQRTSCMACKDCLNGDENLCEINLQLTSGKHYGGFANKIKSDARFAFPIPDGLVSKEAASLMCAGVAVYRGLRVAGMQSGDHIGIIGLGGLGHLAVQYASNLGNKVTVFEYEEHKTELAYELGADQVILTNKELPRSLDYPLSLILNTVNKSLDWRSFMRLLDTKGTLCLLASGDKVKVPFSSLVYQQKSVTASIIGGRYDVVRALEIADQFDIKTYVEEFSLEDANVAIQRLKDNKLTYRAVLNI